LDFGTAATVCGILYRYIMLGRGICEKYELNRYIMLGPENDKQKVLFI
jgi:hypothetical protein